MEEEEEGGKDEEQVEDEETHSSTDAGTCAPTRLCVSLWVPRSSSCKWRGRFGGRGMMTWNGRQKFGDEDSWPGKDRELVSCLS